MRPLFMALLAVQLGCSRRPDDVSLDAVTVPSEISQLSDWVAERERAFDDIIPGAERHIILRQEARTPLSIVYIHGFSASRPEISPVCERVSEALNANLYFTRLQGHGRSSLDAMADATVEGWLTDMAEAFQIGRVLGEQVVFISTSTGGGLVSWLASQTPEDVAAYVYVSPNFGPRNKSTRMLLWPGRKLLLRMSMGEYREWEPDSEGVAKYWTHKYPATALFPMMELTHFANQQDLSVATQPTLVVYSPNDQIVDPERIEARFEEMGGQPKRIVPLENVGDDDNHVLAGDLISPDQTDDMVDEIVSFLRTGLELPAPVVKGDPPPPTP